MTINKLTATFGTLDNETLSFHDGLNIAEVSEEKGGEWCDFAEAMLYGYDSGERGVRSDALCGVPISGAPMEGRMELTSARCDIDLSRTTSAKGAPMQDFSAVYRGTSREIDGVHENNAGEMLTGVKRKTFVRCAVVKGVDSDTPLPARIAALSRSGEEDVSYDKADEQLRRQQLDRRNMRRGKLPELESKMGQLQRELSDTEKTVHDAEALEQSLEVKRSRCADLESAVNELRRSQRRDALDRLNNGQNTLKICSQLHDDSLGALTASREKLRRSRFGTKAEEELESEVNADLAKLDTLKNDTERKPTPILGALCFLLAVVGAALYTTYQQSICVIAAVVFCLASIGLIMRYVKLKNAAGAALTGRQEILDRYSAQDADDIRASLEAHKALWEKVRQAETDEQEARNAYEKALKQQQTLESSALGELDFSVGSSEYAGLIGELSEARNECESITSRLSFLRGRIAAAGDPLVLGSELAHLKAEYETVSDEYDAIELALNTLSDADSVMRNEIAPELGALAYRYMTIACDGAQLLLTDGGEIEVPANSSEALAYLCLRLAICEHAMPEGESLPLMLVGVLSGMDEATAAQAMELLKEIARKRQVILFK